MFPGASAAVEGATYVIVGAPFDATTSFHPGARFGPDRVRHYARSLEPYDRRTGEDIETLAVADAGDVEGGGEPEGYVEFLRSTLNGHVREGAVPMVIGGEHTVTLAGVRATEPDVFVSVDAHLDLRDSYRGRSVCHATVTRRALETVEEAVIVGARSGSEVEWDRARVDDVTVVPPAAVPDWEPNLEGTIYLSVDVDALDPAFAPGTGTPAPFGLGPGAVRSVVEALAPSAVGFDVVEVTDRDDGQAATLAAGLIRRFLFDHATAVSR